MALRVFHWNLDRLYLFTYLDEGTGLPTSTSNSISKAVDSKLNILWVLLLLRGGEELFSLADEPCGLSPTYDIVFGDM